MGLPWDAITQCKSLHSLVLHSGYRLDSNNFDELCELPDNIGGLSALTVLQAPRCGILGALPGTIAALNLLETLSLQNNKLCGELPRLPPNLRNCNLQRN